MRMATARSLAGDGLQPESWGQKNELDRNTPGGQTAGEQALTCEQRIRPFAHVHQEIMAQLSLRASEQWPSA